MIRMNPNKVFQSPPTRKTLILFSVNRPKLNPINFSLIRDYNPNDSKRSFQSEKPFESRWMKIGQTSIRSNPSHSEICYRIIPNRSAKPLHFVLMKIGQNSIRFIPV